MTNSTPKGNTTEKYRHECELRSIGKMSPTQRQNYFKGVAKHRSEKVAADLQKQYAES